VCQDFFKYFTLGFKIYDKKTLAAYVGYRLIPLKTTKFGNMFKKTY